MTEEFDPLTQQVAESLNVAPTRALNDDVQAARGLVAQYIRGNEHQFVHPAAATLLNRAIEKCACELFEQRKAPSGIRSFSDDGTTVRIARDPMVAARPILASVLPLAFS